MSTTSMLTSNALSQQKWAKQGFIDIFKSFWFGHMSQRGVIFTSDELSNARISGAGDNITFNFTGLIGGTGVGEGGTMQGNEQALDLNSDNMVINVVRQAVNSPNTSTIEQQRTNVDFENRARIGLPRWHGSRLDASIFNQLAGVNSTTILVDGVTYAGADRLFVQGLNVPRAPSSDRIIRAGNQANDQSLTATDTFTLDLIDAANERLLTTNPTVMPLDDNSYDLFISHEQAVDLKRDTTGKIQWYSNQLAEVSGGLTKDNLLTLGSKMGANKIAKYANVNIYECARVATGEDSGTGAAIPGVRRAVLCGKNAIAFASPFGGRLTDKNVPLEFRTELTDYDYFKGIEARMMYGAQKLQFDGVDYSSLVISTTAASHAT